MRMIGEKTAVYRNDLGQEIVMDNHVIFLETIDMTGVSGVHSSETLAGADGQVTVDHHLGPRTIPCSLALYDRYGDGYWREKLGNIFSPLLSGTLTVYTKKNKYVIEVRPQNNPTFKRESRKVWKFSVDFVADDPYWKTGKEKSVFLPNAQDVTIVNPCPYEIAPTIFLPATEINGHLNINGHIGFYLNHHDFDIKVDTSRFRVTNAETGENCNQYIDATYDLSVIRLRHGENIVSFEYHGTPPGEPPGLRYTLLSQGEV